MFLKYRFDCLLSRSIEEVIEFQPNILVLADVHFEKFQRHLSNTMFILVGHGFVGKNVGEIGIPLSDIACVYSPWVVKFYEAKGIKPRMQFFVSGFVPMDKVLPTTYDDTTGGKTPSPSDTKTLLYAPTHNSTLNSVELLGDEWIDTVTAAIPCLNIIIKPHPVIPERHPEWMEMWGRAAERHERVILVHDGHADIYQYFRETDLLLTDASSVMFYFLYLNRPIILVNNPRRFEETNWFDPDGPIWTWREIGTEIDHPDQLVPAIQYSLVHPEEKAAIRLKAKEQVFGDLPNGKAGERIANLIISLSESSWFETP